MSAFVTVEYTAPAHWAPYLINDDSSGMDPEDVAACGAWLKRIGLGSPVDVKDDTEFCTWHSARVESPLAADCCTYVFLVRK